MTTFKIQHLTLIIILLAALLLCGCRSVRYVPVESVSVRTDTVVKTERIVSTDTVREHIEVYDLRYDSVAPILDSLNRVIGFNHWHYREREKSNDREVRSLRAQNDSLRTARNRVDSIPYPVEVEKIVTVERHRSWWETALLWAGGVAIALTLALLLTLAWWRKVRNKTK